MTTSSLSTMTAAESLAGMAPTNVFRRFLEAETGYRFQGVVSFTGWSTLLLVDTRDQPGVLRVAKGLFGYNSVLSAAPEQVRSELYGYYWYRQLPPGAQEYAERKFRQEIRLMQELRGTGACPELLHADEDAAIPHYVMEYLPSGSVRSWRGAMGSPAPEAALAFARTLLTALDVLHRHGIVHRDINAENVLIGERGPLIADLGCALVTGEQEAPAPKAPLVSWPPDYDTGYHRATTASDLYCFGMVMYELIMGTMPRYGAAPLSAVDGHDPRLIALIEQCVSWHPGDRPRSAAACLAALEA
jgi:serine/threonine protein kinase